MHGRQDRQLRADGVNSGETSSIQKQRDGSMLKLPEVQRPEELEAPCLPPLQKSNQGRPLLRSRHASSWLLVPETGPGPPFLCPMFPSLLHSKLSSSPPARSSPETSTGPRAKRLCCVYLKGGLLVYYSARKSLGLLLTL